MYLEIHEGMSQGHHWSEDPTWFHPENTQCHRPLLHELWCLGPQAVFLSRHTLHSATSLPLDVPQPCWLPLLRATWHALVSALSLARHGTRLGSYLLSYRGTAVYY